MNIALSRREAVVNVTPLVDVCLVLLIIFLAANRTQSGFDLAVPREEKRPSPRPVEPPIVVSLKASGDVHLNGERIEPGSLEARLKAILAGRSNVLAFFTSEDGARYEAAIAIIDTMNRAGARIGVATGSSAARPT